MMSAIESRESVTRFQARQRTSMLTNELRTAMRRPAYQAGDQLNASRIVTIGVPALPEPARISRVETQLVAVPP